MTAPYVVLDVGSGSTKMGFAGNLQPTFTVPTIVASRQSESSAAGRAFDDLNFVIGEDALNNLASSYTVTYPVRQSIVEDWDALEKLYQQCLFNYLRVDPEDHCFLITEAATASPESRQQLAEIMFETFNVSGLYLGVQAVLSLYAAAGVQQGIDAMTAAAQATSTGTPSTTHTCLSSPLTNNALTPGQRYSHGSSGVGALSKSNSKTGRAGSSKGDRSVATGPHWKEALSFVQAHTGLDPYSLTGVVVDIGEGSTSVIPVMDGFVASSCMRSVGVGGRDLTAHVQQALRNNNVGVPPDMSWEVAKKIKEEQCYVCPDPKSEPERVATRLSEGFAAKSFTFYDPRAGKDITIPLGAELYTAPELLLTSCPTASATSTAYGLHGGQTLAGTAPQTATAQLINNANRIMGGWQPLPQLVDSVVQSCPIDARRPLYSCVALTGGTSGVRKLGKRVQVDLAKIANNRVAPGAKPIDVCVRCGGPGGWGQAAAWIGGSLLAGGAAPAGLLTAATTSRAHWQETGTLIGEGLSVIA